MYLSFAAILQILDLNCIGKSKSDVYDIIYTALIPDNPITNTYKPDATMISKVFNAKAEPTQLVTRVQGDINLVQFLTTLDVNLNQTMGSHAIHFLYEQLLILVQCAHNVPPDTVLDSQRGIRKRDLLFFEDQDTTADKVNLVGKIILWTLTYTKNKDKASATTAHDIHQAGRAFFIQAKDSITTDPISQVQVVSYTRPLQPSAYFVGREQMLTDIIANLEGVAKTVVITGMGGMGKTEICRRLFHYALDGRIKSITHVAWINYDTTLAYSIKESFPHMADVEQAMAMLNNRHLLLIVDNANTLTPKEEAQLSKLECRTLISARRNQYQRHRAVDVGPLNLQECRDLYTWHLLDDSPHLLPTETIYHWTEKIVVLADYHTLAIELLAKTQASLGMGMSDFHGILEKHGFSLQNIFTTKVSYLHSPEVEENLDQETELAFIQQFAKLFDISGLASAHHQLMTEAALLASRPLHKEKLSQWLGRSDVKTAITELLHSGWLKQDYIDEETFGVYVHPLIAATVRYIEKPSHERVKEMAHQVAQSLIVEDMLDERGIEAINAYYLWKNTLPDQDTPDQQDLTEE